MCCGALVRAPLSRERRAPSNDAPPGAGAPPVPAGPPPTNLSRNPLVWAMPPIPAESHHLDPQTRASLASNRDTNARLLAAAAEARRASDDLDRKRAERDQALRWLEGIERSLVDLEHANHVAQNTLLEAEEAAKAEADRAEEKSLTSLQARGGCPPLAQGFLSRLWCGGHSCRPGRGAQTVCNE